MEEPVRLDAVLDALETGHPACVERFATRHLKRRPFVSFFACKADLSHDPPDTLLPDAVAAGSEPILIIGAIAGG